jgi:Zn-finger nucleic acid-binding protein
MSDSWDERRRAQEEGYFDLLNKQAVARIAAKKGQPARPSPVTGKPMEVVSVMGVVLDRCVDSGGIWLDSGELDELLGAAKDNPASLKDFVSLVPASASGSATAAVTGGKKSPISGKPMNHDTVLDIAIDRCEESGGIWIDAGELQRLLASSHQSLGRGIKDFFAMVVGKKRA